MESVLSHPGPKPRSGRPPATTYLPAQTPVLFSTAITQLLARRVLPATQNFLTPNKSHKDTANIYASYLRSHFSQQTPRLSHVAERSFMNDLRSDQCSDSYLHNTFYFPFITKELTTAISKLSTSTASGPDFIAYPLLTHLLPSAQQHFLSIFNWSWSFHTFPSCWKPATIIPTYKPSKTADSPASYRPISLTSCISKLFERLVLNRLCYYLKSSNLISPTQAGFRPGRSTVVRSSFPVPIYEFWDSFQKKRPPDRTVLATIDFYKAFDSVWHSVLFHNLLTLGLPPCFVRLTRSFLSDRRAKVLFRVARSRSFQIRRGVPQGFVLGSGLFILYVDDLAKTLSQGTKHSLYADDLAI